MYVQAVRYFDLVCHAIVIFDFELECSCAIDVYPLFDAFYPPHISEFQVFEKVRCGDHAALGMGIYPDGIGVGIKADGLGAVDRAQQRGKGWLGNRQELPQLVRGKNLPQPSFNLTTNSEHGNRDWDEVSSES
jgi:hypothetical protein